MSDLSEARKFWRIAVLASGGGTNLQALIEAQKKGEINGEIVVVVANTNHAYALTRAQEAGIEPVVFNPDKFSTRTQLGSKIQETLQHRKIDLIVLAGYLLKIEPCLIRAYPNRIINIHPALLPQYGGKGMYGHHVHQAVIENKEKESGCTVHVVDEIFDHGPIIAQSRVPVMEGDTPKSLYERIQPKEHELLKSVVMDICAGRIDLDRLQPLATSKDS